MDIGIASCGCAIISPEKHRIEDLGVRIFEKAEHPKDRSSLSAPRRKAHSTRKTFQKIKRVWRNQTIALYEK
ncbi:hypothetical protein [Bacillus thuringiensis]|uniref:hypothetical protein n=1 Tax=Bacillus thuringiensis TaxID=1428 RepID=UPI0007F97E32|nr:hypothetical protein [Bacillus thuringiensis]ARV91352.1 hypothetical protein BJG91_01455 [Bacillus thuringiensis]MEB9661062.1 hypothetical protein [Bacillus cereus]